MMKSIIFDFLFKDTLIIILFTITIFLVPKLIIHYVLVILKLDLSIAIRTHVFIIKIIKYISLFYCLYALLINLFFKPFDKNDNCLLNNL